MLLFLVCLLANNILHILIDFFGEMRLHISRQQISRIFNLFGIERHSPLSSPMQNISQLERTKDIANRPYLII